MRVTLGDRIVVLRLGAGQVTARNETRDGVVVDVDVQLKEPPAASCLDGEEVIRSNVKLLEQFVVAFFSQ